jgi:hypothetical protein
MSVDAVPSISLPELRAATTPELRRQRVAVSVAFATLGLTWGSFGSRLPALKSHTGISKLELSPSPSSVRS